MAVNNPYVSTRGVENGVNETNRLLNKVVDKMTHIEESQVQDGILCLCRRNMMFYWNKLDKAANYRLQLFLNDIEIDVIEIERTKSYYTFNDLVGSGYKIILEIEDRSGSILKKISMNF